VAFAIAVVNIRCGGVDLCGERSGVAAAFAVGRVFAMAGFAVAGEDCTSFFVMIIVGSESCLSLAWDDTVLVGLLDETELRRWGV
jgi:hypothetical protein